MKPPADRVLDWLLEKSDPGVRYFTLRDLLGAPADDADAVAARRATVRASPVKEILLAQDTDGWWCKPGPGYSPKYQGTVWSVIFLGQFGADGSNRQVRKAAEYVLDHTRAPEPFGGFSANGTPAAMIHCLQGNLCTSLLELGWGEDLRLRQALDWLARSIVGERIEPTVALGQRTPKAGPRDLPRFYRSGNSGPGFLCSANNHRACAWGAIPAMDALQPGSAARADEGGAQGHRRRRRVLARSRSGAGRLPDALRRASPTEAGSDSDIPWATCRTSSTMRMY